MDARLKGSDGREFKRQVIDAAQKYLAVPADSPEELEKRATTVNPLIERVARGVFRLVVIGEVKKGKSSFINALLGQPDLLPTASDVTTSTVYKVIYGPLPAYTVYLLPSLNHPERVPEPLSIRKEQLWEYGTEAGNPGNAKNVDFIAVEVPSPLLREGITIVDTPGVGGLFKAHRDITFRYAPNADAVFFVVDSVESLIGADEVSFLGDLKKVTKQIFFVQTKIDNADEAQWEAWRTRNLEIISKTLETPKKQIPYFPVSSTLKLRADEDYSGLDLTASGFLAVIQFLHNVLLPRKDRILALQAARALYEDVTREAQTIADRLTIAKETSQERLASYKVQLTEAQSQLRQWENGVWKKRVRDFQDEVAQLKRDTNNRIQDSFSADSVAFSELIEQVHGACHSVEQVSDRSEGDLSDYGASCSLLGREILETFNRDYQAIYLRIVSGGAAELREAILRDVSVEVGNWRKYETGRLEAIRSGFMNFSTVGSLTGGVSYGVQYAAGAAIGLGLISNPVGWTIAIGAAVTALATTIWATAKGYRSVRERQLSVALANLERSLQEVSQRAYRATQRAFQELASELDTHARDGFDAFVESTRAEFDRRIREVNEALTRSTEESRRAVEALTTRLKGLSELVREITAVGDAAKTAV